MARRPGRPRKSYDPKAGPTISGLRPLGHGRWSLTLPGGKRHRFTEHDESAAVAKARQILAASDPKIEMPVNTEDQSVEQAFESVCDAAIVEPEVLLTFELNKQPIHNGKVKLSAVSFWAAVKHELLQRPAFAAQMTGIPALASLPYLDIPKPDLKLEEVIDTYRSKNPASDKAKREATKSMERLIKVTGAVRLADLTTERLQAFRENIETDEKLKRAGTRRAYYGRIKNVIAFGLKAGLDPVQLRAALDRCKVLWTAEPMPVVNPKPISREHFHKLLEAAADGSWRAWLLMGLNLCLHMEEVCGLRWTDFNLDAGTHAAIREKTRRKRIPRAAVLCPETLTELRKLSRRGEYVFTSSHGTRYNKNTRINDFREFRTASGLPDTVTFDTLRDGAFTAASHGTTDDRLAKILASHSCGMSDSYVQRNPAIVRPACEAVYKAYGPFPTNFRS